MAPAGTGSPATNEVVARAVAQSSATFEPSAYTMYSKMFASVEASHDAVAIVSPVVFIKPVGATGGSGSY